MRMQHWHIPRPGRRGREGHTSSHFVLLVVQDADSAAREALDKSLLLCDFQGFEERARAVTLDSVEWNDLIMTCKD